ncbi:MAG: glycosyltransferase family 4 protein [Bacteroidales bacterium]|nr:glycosyltransferase family 4 protein [Bacteroidales bacterium]
MIIGFDAKRIVRNNTGLGNYCRTLINDMIRCNDSNMKLLLYTPDKGRDVLRNQIIESDNSKFIFPKKKLGKIYKSLWRTKNIVKQLQEDKVQIYHGLSGELPLGLRNSGIKSVVTIHDLIFLRHPEYYHWFDRKMYTWKFHQTIKQADRIIAVSERTKRDILEFGKIDPEKISVIYQSCNPKFTNMPTEGEMEATSKKYDLPKRYLLCVGTIEERKNLMLAVRSLSLLPEDIHLVAVGKKTKYADKVMETADKTGVSHRLHLLSGVSDDELNVIYKKAEVFVYPSRYEGFGIPIIEAIFCGLPVVASTGSCLEEAGGPDCLYVNPDDTEGMAAAIMQLLNNEEERKRRIISSLEYVQKYKGTNIANAVIEVYEELTLNFDL